MGEDSKNKIGISEISKAKDSNVYRAQDSLSEQIYTINNWASVGLDNYVTDRLDKTWIPSKEVEITTEGIYTKTITKFEGVELPHPIEVPASLDVKGVMTAMLNAWIEDAEKLKKVKEAVKKAKAVEEANRAKQKVNENDWTYLGMDRYEKKQTEDWQEFFGK